MDMILQLVRVYRHEFIIITSVLHILVGRIYIYYFLYEYMNVLDLNLLASSTTSMSYVPHDVRL